jgi:hypothetical protein
MLAFVFSHFFIAVAIDKYLISFDVLFFWSIFRPIGTVRWIESTEKYPTNLGFILRPIHYLIADPRRARSLATALAVSVFKANRPASVAYQPLPGGNDPGLIRLHHHSSVLNFSSLWDNPHASSPPHWLNLFLLIIFVCFRCDASLPAVLPVDSRHHQPTRLGSIPQQLDHDSWYLRHGAGLI